MVKTAAPSQAGFACVVTTERFKCAFITHGEAYSYGKVEEMKRHNATEEVFVLLSGKATLLTLEGESFEETPLMPGAAYCVCPGTWHHLAVSPDAMLFVTENSDTDKTNTDVKKLDPPYWYKERE